MFFPNTQCDLSSKLTAHNIIINLTLCMPVTVFVLPPLLTIVY